jgi:hypothetical protein
MLAWKCMETEWRKNKVRENYISRWNSVKKQGMLSILLYM